jgi:hypothetical protein
MRLSARQACTCSALGPSAAVDCVQLVPSHSHVSPSHPMLTASPPKSTSLPAKAVVPEFQRADGCADAVVGPESRRHRLGDVVRVAFGASFRSSRFSLSSFSMRASCSRRRSYSAWIAANATPVESTGLYALSVVPSEKLA